MENGLITEEVSPFVITRLITLPTLVSSQLNIDDTHKMENYWALYTHSTK